MGSLLLASAIQLCHKVSYSDQLPVEAMAIIAVLLRQEKPEFEFSCQQSTHWRMLIGVWMHLWRLARRKASFRHRLNNNQNSRKFCVSMRLLMTAYSCFLWYLICSIVWLIKVWLTSRNMTFPLPFIRIVCAAFTKSAIEEGRSMCS